MTTSLSPGAQTIEDRRTQTTDSGDHERFSHFVEKEKLYGLSCGLIDVTLLMSTLITPGATLMTADRRLSALAERFKVLHRTALH